MRCWPKGSATGSRVLIVDTSAVFAALDRGERRHTDVVAVAEHDDGPLYLSPFVLAELDYLVITRLGVRVELDVLGQVAAGAWTLAPFDAIDVAAAIDVIDRYADQKIGLADASLLVLADRYHTDRILTLNRRHFDVLRQRDGRRFQVLPE